MDRRIALSPEMTGAPSSAETSQVIVSCAEADASTVEEAAASLRHRGHEVEVVKGVEADAELLTAAIRKFERNGLYVLCRSRVLDRQRVDRLRAVLRAHEVPFGRTLTLPIEPGQARALEERIVSVARRMVTGRPEPAPRPPGLPRRAMERSSHAAPDGDVGAELDEEGESTSPSVEADEVAAWADSLIGKVTDPDIDGARAADESNERLPVSGPGTPPATADAPNEAPKFDAPDRVQPGYELRETQRMAAVKDDGASALPVPPAPSPGPQPRPYRPVAQTVRADAIPPAPSPSIDDTNGDLAAAGIGGGGAQSRSTLLIGVGVVVLLLGGGGIALAVGGDDDDEVEVAQPDEEKKPSKAEKTSEATPSAKSDGPPESADANAAGVEPAGEAPSAEVEATPAAATKGGDAAKADAPGATAAAEAPGDNSAVIEIEEPQDPPSVEDSQAVLTALRDREIRALDTLLVAEAVSKDTTHAGALQYCQGLTVAGLTGWRLPSIGELASLGEGKMMKKGLYWSDTPGDAFGDKRLVLNSKKDRIVPVPVTWDGAKAVCIRERS